jgi:hypothetical protein
MVPSIFMAKFRLAGRKPKASAKPAAAVPCVVLILAGLALVMLFLWFVLKNSVQ